MRFQAMIMTAGFGLATLSGCGAIGDLIDEAKAKADDIKAALESVKGAEESAEAAKGVQDTTNEMDELSAMADDPQGVVPDSGQAFPGGAEGDAAALSPSLWRAAAAGGFAPAGVDDACPADGSDDPLPEDAVCKTVSVEDHGEGVTQAVRVVYYYPDGNRDGAEQVIDLSGTTYYADGSTSELTVTDLEAPNGTVDANLLHHKVEVREYRTYGVGNARVRSEDGRVVLNVNGAFDEDNSAEDEGPDDIYSATMIRTFRGAEGAGTGRVETVQVYPADAPVHDREEIAAGTITREVSFAAGPRVNLSETFTWDDAAGTAKGRATETYADSSTGYESWNVEPGLLRHYRKGPRGETVKTEMDFDAETFTRSIHPPSDAPVKGVEEAGSIVRAEGSVTLDFTRTVVLRAGGEERTDLTVVRTDAAVDIDWDKSYPDDTTETGTIDIARGEVTDTVDGRVLLRNGNVIELTAERNKDTGESHMTLTIDDPETAQNPDVTGEFTWYADGSGEGTLTLPLGGSFDITINAAGQVNASGGGGGSQSS